MKLKEKLKQYNLVWVLLQCRSNSICFIKTIINILYIKTRDKKVAVYTYKSLVKSIKKKNDVCHVIATGSSAVDAYKNKVIKKNDYVIGLNFAAFLPYKFDLYFCEETSRVIKDDERIREQVDLLIKRGVDIQRIVFKNLYSSNIKYLVNILSDFNIKYSVIFDKQVMFDTVNTLIAKPGIMMPQYSSTVITAIMLAYHAGFKNIVVHGLDFSGPYIYHDEELQKQIGIEAPTPYVAKSVVHGTAVSQELIWDSLISEFSKRGIHIYCASINSNFKKYAELWTER